MPQVIGQVWREVVGCRNWPVMRVPQFIALRRNVDLEKNPIIHILGFRHRRTICVWKINKFTGSDMWKFVKFYKILF